MKRHLLLLCLLSVHFLSFAQVRDMGGPRTLKLNVAEPLDFIRMPSFDLAKDLLEDSINDALKIGPWRFGHRFSTDIGMETGTWHEFQNGDRVWRVGISSPGAVSINIIFDEFHVSEGTFVHIYSPDGSQILGAYTAYNNNSEDVLGSELITGDALIVEYYEPAGTQRTSELNIGYVTHGYRSVGAYAQGLARAFGDSDDCNVDVNCPAGSGWTNQINSVAMIVVGGNGICSGALVNNTCNDGTPYFLTADHCVGTNAPSTMSWAFRFNWQAPVGGTSCATTSPSTNPGTYNQTAYGANLVANNSNSDFALLQISNLSLTDAQNWNCHFAGWDHTDAGVTSGTGIHHPHGDIKKICHENNGLTQQIWGGAKTWRIANWDEGVTEPGSSGSPLFDQNGRIVGQLYGGSAACSGTNDNGQPDFYGRFGVSWDAVVGNDNQLEPWLDACGTGATTDDGWSPTGPLPTDDMGVQFILDPDGNICGDSVFQPKLVLKNFGSNLVTAVDVVYSIDAGANQTYSWTGSLTSGATTTVTLPQQIAGGGNHSFSAQTFEPNGNPDNNTLNDDAQSSFDIIINGDLTHLNLDLDCWGTEVTWEVQDQISGTAYYVGGPYADVSPNGISVKDSFCLESDCYNYVIFDSFGDGMTGTMCNVAGYYNLTNSIGDTLTEMLAAGAAYGSSETNLFCVNKVSGTGSMLQSDLKIYPNPGIGNVVLENSGVFSDATLTIYDITGKLLMETYISGRTNRIELDLDLQSGTYIIRVSDSKQYATSKLIINKN